jgi:hypothetical protein
MENVGKSDGNRTARALLQPQAEIGKGEWRKMKTIYIHVQGFENAVKVQGEEAEEIIEYLESGDILVGHPFIKVTDHTYSKSELDEGKTVYIRVDYITKVEVADDY